MDPNELLATIRRCIAEIQGDNEEGLDPDATYDLAEAVRNLDTWLSNGGFPPAAWLAPSAGASTITVPVGDVDWSALLAQKLDLLRMIDQNGPLMGIVHLIDHIQDTAAEQLGEEPVFGPPVEDTP